MQHPDEGTIHSWLDGALSAEEATRVEAHVKDCPECAAAVAEARGFIAASSRILTALDNAPRGVIPVAAPKKRVDPMVWRIAATLFVVAGGTFVVLRNGGREAPISVINNADSGSSTVTAVTPRVSDNIAVAPSASNKAERTPPAAEAPTPTRSPGNISGAVTGGVAQNEFSGEPVAKMGAAGMSTANGSPTATAAPSVAAAPSSQPNRSPALYGRLEPRSATTTDAGVAIPRALTPAPAASVAALDAATEPEALKIVGTGRQTGAKTTLYEVATGDTVTLTEMVGVQLQGAVATASSATRTADQSTEKSARSQPTKSTVAPTVSAPDSQLVSLQAASSANARAGRAGTGNVQVVNGVTTISWTDPVTRNAMKLSGRMSPARLQQVKAQIERERAAEAAKKKP